MSLSKDAIVKALAKPAVWGVGDKKRAVLLTLVANCNALLARVGQSSQDQRATLRFQWKLDIGLIRYMAFVNSTIPKEKKNRFRSEICSLQTKSGNLTFSKTCTGS
jgi:hypothetical protein